MKSTGSQRRPKDLIHLSHPGAPGLTCPRPPLVPGHSPVLLTHKQVKRILSPQEIVIVQDFHRAHPVGVEVSSNLQTDKGQQERPISRVWESQSQHLSFSNSKPKFIKPSLMNVTQQVPPRVRPTQAPLGCCHPQQHLPHAPFRSLSIQVTMAVPLREQSLTRVTLAAHLFEVALHGLVGEQQHGAHKVTHQDEIALGLQVEGHDVIVVIAFSAKLLLRGPLIKPHLRGAVQLSIAFPTLHFP